MNTYKTRLAAAVPPMMLGMMVIGNAEADTFGAGPNAFTMGFVEVGEPGNPDDSGTTGSYSSNIGGVAEDFRIGTREVSRDMIERSNILGSLGITLANMASYGGGDGDHPATGVTWNEVARFVNFLNEDAGFSHAYKFALQPGDAGYDPNANILLWDPGDAGYDPTNLYRNADAFYFLPSADQWYKAAYYSGSGAVYHDYALGSDSIPTAVSGGTGTDEAVYAQLASVGPADIDNAGGLSPYGTMGQNGNVWEWLESALDGSNNAPFEFREFRGGDWSGAELFLRSSHRGTNRPFNGIFDVGFRVASAPGAAVVPEPSTGLLGLTGVGTLLLGRRRRASP